MRAQRLGLVLQVPWHTRRRPVTRLGDTLAGAVAAAVIRSGQDNPGTNASARPG